VREFVFVSGECVSSTGGGHGVGDRHSREWHSHCAGGGGPAAAAAVAVAASTVARETDVCGLSHPIEVAVAITCTLYALKGA
jgi:hypothetical protein